MAEVRHNFDARSIVDAIVRGVDLGTQELVKRAQQKIKVSISGEGTGVKYPGNPRRSSREGQPPAKQRGDLSRSWQTGQATRVSQGKRLGWRVGSNKRYARILEFGNARIGERPYVRPALKEVEKDAAKIMEIFIRDQMRRLRLPQPAKT